MPMIDGFDVITWLRERPRLRDLSIAVVTSSTRASDQQRAVENGVSEYLEKFPTEADLARVVHWATSHHLPL
jgi:chemosensory pili system protein ChpA (sensor histidine kinase/response regulator)